MENNNMLAKISLGINGVLLILVIILFVKMPGGDGEEGEDEEMDTQVNVSGSEGSTIAYFNNDSLNLYSDFVVDAQEEIQLVTEEAQNRIVSKENQIRATQKKWNDKGNLLPREIEQAQMELAKLEEEYMILQQEVQMDLGNKQAELMATMYQRVTLYAQSFCANNDIDILMSYQLGGQMVYINSDLDVTEEFINHTNLEYSGGGSSPDGEPEEDPAEDS